ncbi:glutamine--tRNA ligase/YqeY domain fusion protein [Halocola ammonii]
MSNPNTGSKNFIELRIEKDLAEGKHETIKTRFPPEPNGFLHIGHAKSIVLNFTLGQQYNGSTNLRFDDTNPVKEESRYVESIKRDIKWLGYDWGENEFYASDYFDKLYDYAVELIKKGKAYVDDQSVEEISATRGTPTQPGTESPYRNRSVEENLDLFARMKEGEFPDGSKVVRAKIDMSSPNMHMRDPAMYRIKNHPHHRTGNKWHIYPMYDFAHGLSDSIEGITHSLCSLEFEVHRPLYDWFLRELNTFPSQQIEFARLNLSYTIMSKRKLLKLVEEGVVEDWDDPRMPTISGLRRRGYSPASIRNFAQRIGVAKRNNVIDVSMLEHSVREDLNKTAPRVMAVLDPLKVVITNYPEGKTEELEVENNPEDESAGSRMMPFSREIYIEQDDFMEDPPKKFFRLGPGRMSRLKGAYIIECEDYVKDEKTGKITELHCKYFPESKSGEDTSGLKVKGTLHWVSAEHAIDAEVRLYDRLFTEEDPEADKTKTFMDFLNPDSLQVLKNCKVEPSLKAANPEDRFQFQRLGYFCADRDMKDENLIFNRTVTLRDTWAKKSGK